VPQGGLFSRGAAGRCRAWIFLAALPALLTPAPARAEEPGVVPAGGADSAPPSPDDDPAAEAALARARLDLERGDFAEAAAAFAELLQKPVRLKKRENLHAGFLFWGFTLFLMDDPDGASARLSTALRIDPEYLPSPVTTRPDLLAFYTGLRTSYLREHPSREEPLEQIFPELIERPMAQYRWIPTYGLRLLGYRRVADGLLGVGAAAGAVNVLSLVLRLAVYENLGPDGWALRHSSRGLNYGSFAVFYAAVIAEVVVTAALLRAHRMHPELRRAPAARLRGPREAGAGTGPAGPRAAFAPRPYAGPDGLGLSFW
jgi:tetratricopeptide (TPR) repeat protein